MEFWVFLGLLGAEMSGESGIC